MVILIAGAIGILVFILGIIYQKPIVSKSYQGLRKSIKWYSDIAETTTPTDKEWADLAIKDYQKSKTRRLLWGIKESV